MNEHEISSHVNNNSRLQILQPGLDTPTSRMGPFFETNFVSLHQTNLITKLLIQKLCQINLIKLI